MVMKQGKEAGGAWDCYEADNFYGWEAEKVVAVTSGRRIMELITRARTMLHIIFTHDDALAETKGYFQQASAKGLVEIK